LLQPDQYFAESAQIPWIEFGENDFTGMDIVEIIVMSGELRAELRLIQRVVIEVHAIPPELIAEWLGSNDSLDYIQIPLDVLKRLFLSVVPASVTIDEGDIAYVAVSGGQSPYTATSADSSVATAYVTGSTVIVQGISAGSTTITVRDNSIRMATIQVTVNSCGGG
jgi:hypothetical protein